jgi:hypothetical protein
MKKYISFVLIGLFCVSNLKASEPAIWSINSRSEWLKGDARGVSITDTGAITLAPKLSEIFKTEQPYVWSSAIDAAGNVFLGTGSDGRIYRVDASGKGAVFADTNELNVSALAIGKNRAFAARVNPINSPVAAGTQKNIAGSVNRARPNVWLFGLENFREFRRQRNRSRVGYRNAFRVAF